MDYLSLHNLPELFFLRARELQDREFLWHKSGGKFQPLTWAQVAAQVRALSKGLRAFGIAPGDRVVLVSESRPEWLIADFAIMCCGAITVPAYTTNTVDDHKHILEDSGARAVIISTAPLAEKVLRAAAQLPIGSGGHLLSILMDNPGSLPCHSWQELIKIGQEQKDHISEMIGQLNRTDTACIIYTSGTGGVPKGVMQSHGSVLHNCRGAYEMLKTLGLGKEKFLSFLPLSHSYEHTAGQMFPLSIGAEIYYAEGAEKLSSNLLEARPTIMTAVPRLYEMFYQRILAGTKKMSKFQRFLFNWTVKLGKKSYLAPQRMNILDRIANPLLTLLVRRINREDGRIALEVTGPGL
jgi:long-chain acyl-CoA synthetase